MASSSFCCRVQTLAFCVLFAGCSMSFLGCIRGGYPRACYPQFTYTWHPSSQVIFTHKGFDSSYDSKPGIAPIYLKLKDGSILYLPEITLATADDVLTNAGWRKTSGAVNPGGVWYEDDYSRVHFDSGTLDSITLDSISDVEIALVKDGPFVTMPETKEDLVALFGEPVDWRSYHPPTTP